MKDSTKRLLLIGGSLLVVGGVIYYYVRKAKPGEASDDEEITDTSTIAPIGTTPGAPIVTGGPGVIIPNPTGETLPIELNSVEKVKAFQDFMDSVGPWVKGIDGKYKKLNKGTGYGIAGPSTKAIFNIYGDLYRVYTRAGSKGRILPLGAGNSSASIDVDLSNGTIARYSNDKKFVHFAKNYGSAINTGTWSNGGRKVTIGYGPKKGKVIDKDIIWDTLKELIA
jgi:hypothetical protein